MREVARFACDEDSDVRALVVLVSEMGTVLIRMEWRGGDGHVEMAPSEAMQVAEALIGATL